MSPSFPSPPSSPQPGDQRQHISPGHAVSPPHQPLQLKLPPPDGSSAGESILGTPPPTDGNVSAGSSSTAPLEAVPLSLLPPPKAPAGGKGELDNEDGLHADGEFLQQNAAAWALDGLPPGYRFTPQDDELISFYLRNKILGLPLPVNKIHDVRLYDHNPDDLAARHEQWGEGKWFFFTPRDRKYRNGHRPSRSAGDGYWKATGADKPIRRNGVHVGVRKALVFYIGRPPKGDKTNWIMHEYRINDSKGPRQYDGTMKLDDWVLCTIYEKARGAVRKRTAHQVPSNQHEGGRKKQVPVREATLPRELPASENSIDVSNMHQGLSNGTYHDQSYDSMGNFPPHDPIVQERFPAPVFLHETSENGNGQVPWNQSSGAIMHSTVMPPASELGYPVEDNLPASVLDDYEMWFDGAGDSRGFVDSNIDAADHLLSNLHKFDPAYLPFGFDALPTTDARDSSHFFSSGPAASANLKNTAPYETGVPYGYGATPETGATFTTSPPTTNAVDSSDFFSDGRTDAANLWNTALLATGATYGYGVTFESGATSAALTTANDMDSSNYFFSSRLPSAANLENTAPFKTDATYGYAATPRTAATIATCGISGTGSGATFTTCGTWETGPTSEDVASGEVIPNPAGFSGSEIKLAGDEELPAAAFSPTGYSFRKPG